MYKMATKETSPTPPLQLCFKAKVILQVHLKLRIQFQTVITYHQGKIRPATEPFKISIYTRTDLPFYLIITLL